MNALSIRLLMGCFEAVSLYSLLGMFHVAEKLAVSS